jgi:hypothetical protein
MIYLLFTLAMASNTASEAMLKNEGTQAIVCMKDVNGEPSRERILPGQVCQGDAVLLPTGKVFKVPNLTAFSCNDETCVAADLVSWLIMHYAINKRHGEQNYGEMDLMWFEGIMGW